MVDACVWEWLTGTKRVSRLSIYCFSHATNH